MFPSPVSFFASRKVRDSFGVQNGFFFQAWTQAFFWLRASRKPAAAAGIKERENEKRNERKEREKGTKEKTFSSFLLGQLALHLRHRLQDLFSSELQRMAFFCFLSRCQKSDVQMQRREKMLRFYFKFFPPLSFLLLFPHLELLSPF